jgi:hypothetical protein
MACGLGMALGGHWAGLILCKKIERLESGNLGVLEYDPTGKPIVNKL